VTRPGRHASRCISRNGSQRIEDRPDRPIVAHFTDGTSAEGDFLIGADGMHSAVRSHVVPDGPTPCDNRVCSASAARAAVAARSGRRPGRASQ